MPEFMTNPLGRRLTGSTRMPVAAMDDATCATTSSIGSMAPPSLSGSPACSPRGSDVRMIILVSSAVPYKAWCARVEKVRLVPSLFIYRMESGMRMTKSKIIQRVVAASISATLMQVALAQDPSEICKSVPVVFKDTVIKTKETYKSSYKSLLCSASWSTYQDAVNAGIDVTIPIYDIPVPLSANYSQSKQQAWQSANCSQEERQVDFASTGYLLAKEISPATASSWLECIRATQVSAIPRALSCKITETDSATVFEAKWRFVEGAKPDEAPVVRSFDIINTKCPGAASFKKGTKIGTGGAAVLCDGNTQKAPMFVLNTDRGSCSASGVLASKVTQLGGKIELKSPMVFKGENVKIGADLNIVTNGYNLTIDANRLVIDGAPQIMSFVADQPVQDRRGDSAGEVRIKAKKLEGGVLTVQNFGQNGGPGSAGGKGNAGNKGSPGARRHWKNLEGCTGGHGGGSGSQGAKGFTGNAGATGGNGGDVLIEVDQGLMDGAKERIAILTKRTDRANNPFECGGTCPGLGGIGGGGGEGGDGGAGGDGAGGDPPCGGHPGGPPGPKGPQGDTGSEGRRGSPGRITTL